MRTFIVKLGPFIYLVPANTRTEAEELLKRPGAKTVGVLEVGTKTDSIQGPFDAKLYTSK